MILIRQLLFSFFILLLAACLGSKNTTQTSAFTAPFVWENANMYFMLTDRFNNGSKKNDVNFGRTKPSATLRGFMGGDILGITQKIEDGYFTNLGITAIWFTPVVEQVHDQTDEGTGATYAYHGYWTKDWTSLDPNFGTDKELADLVAVAHQRGIRVVLDVVINHTGPVTPDDPQWPDAWVRTGPKCAYKDYVTTTACTLVKNLPDIRTESNEPVDLPQALLDKWKKEGRLQKELDELDAFFKRTGYPRAPKYYIIKWLTDMIRKYGVDGFRCDTVKHLEEDVWNDLRKEADAAFFDWKKANPTKILDRNGFYMVGEVYNYNITSGRNFDFGDKKVDYYNHGFHSLINFDLKGNKDDLETIFSKYSNILHGELKGHSVLNYVSSHDDDKPYDDARVKPLEAGTRLLLCPGTSQVYYGDETARSLIVPGTNGDATLRSFMNWDELSSNTTRSGYHVKDVLEHWQKLGQFRRDHASVGAGKHTMLSQKPYIFKREYQQGSFSNVVVVGLGLQAGGKIIEVGSVYQDGTQLRDYYSGQTVTVKQGKASVKSPYDIVLLGKMN